MEKQVPATMYNTMYYIRRMESDVSDTPETAPL